jgi:hypothetical protein
MYCGNEVLVAVVTDDKDDVRLWRGDSLMHANKK